MECEIKKIMGIHIWKRFGPKSAYQYLHLDGVYTVGTSAKKKQQVYLKGGSGYIYKQDPGEKKKLDNQQLINVGHSGTWKKFYGGAKDTRGFRWTAKATPPVRTSFDHFVDNWDRGVHRYTTAREAAAVANQEVLDKQTAEHDRQLGLARVSAAIDRARSRREQRARSLNEAATTYAKMKEVKAQKLAENKAALQITKLFMSGRKQKKNVEKALKYYRETAKPTQCMTGWHRE